MSQPEPDERAERTSLALFELARSIVRFGTKDMSLTAAATLGTLRDAGALRMTSLAERERVAQPSMTELINRLERDGLVSRRRDPVDGRAVTVALTPAGMDLVGQRQYERAEVMASLVAQLDKRDQKLLIEALPALETLTVLAQRVSDPPVTAESPEPPG